MGAGTGAVAGAMKGGVGTASVVLGSGITVGALAVVNAAGSAVDPLTGVLYGDGVQGWADRPAAEVHAAAQRRLAEAREETRRRSAPPVRPVLNTILAVVATDAELSRAQAQKLAGTAHDGLARALRPVHLLTDGDIVFALATGARPLPAESPGSGFGAYAGADVTALNDVLGAGADALARAVVKAVLAAEGVEGAGGVYPAYRDLY